MDIPYLSGQKVFRPIILAAKQHSQVSPGRKVVVWVLLGLTVLFALAGLPLWDAYHGWQVEHYQLTYSKEIAMLLAGIGTASMLIMALLGALIIFAQPQNTIGWVLLVAMVIGNLVGFCEKYAVYGYAIAPERNLPFWALTLWIQHWVWVLFISLLLMGLPLLFPDGRLPSARWKWLAWWIIGIIAILVFIMAFHPDIEIENAFLDIENDLTNPYGITLLPPIIAKLLLPAWLLYLFTLPVVVYSLFTRFRNADLTAKQQIKWFSTWLGTVILLFFLRDLDPLFHYQSWVPEFLRVSLLIVFNGLPIILGIAIFKYRLYDIDIIINRTLVYGLLSIFIVGMYILIVGVIGRISHSSNNLFPSLLATGVAALSFQRLRDMIQQRVNHLLFGQRDEPYTVLVQLSERLKSTIMPDDMLLQTAQTIMTSLKLPYVRIRIHRGEDIITQIYQGEATSATVAFPLIYHYEAIGELVVGQRSTHEVLTKSDIQVLQGIIQQLGAVAYAIRLQIELKAARERLVTKLEAERRRIRRDLHDGLGPALASQTLKLDAAIYFFATEPETALQFIEDVREQSDTLIHEVRQLIHNLRPPALDEMGLVGAIRTAIARFQVGHQQTRIEFVAGQALPTVSAALEAGAYRIIMEAVTNVLRHGEATFCKVSLKTTDGMMQIRVQDNGCGIEEPAVMGVGLQSMRERAEELSGSLSIDSRSGSGTTIVAQIPLRGEL